MKKQMIDNDLQEKMNNLKELKDKSKQVKVYLFS